MSQAKILQEKAEMFERRAESATDPISRQHYKEMAAHYRSLAVEHLEVHRDEPATLVRKGRRHLCPSRRAASCASPTDARQSHVSPQPPKSAWPRPRTLRI